MMVDKVVDNNESKTLSKVKLHGEFIFSTLIGQNGAEHSDSAVPYAKHAEIA